MPLDERLEPLHDPINVSPEGAQAFWSVVHHRDGYVFLAYIREIDGKHQLWGSSVHCK